MEKEIKKINSSLKSKKFILFIIVECILFTLFQGQYQIAL